MPTTIDKNQYDYLNSLVASGGGNGEWAKAQLAESSYVPAPTPPPAYTAPAPNYSTPSTPSYSIPAPAYTGAANVIGNTNSGSSMQNIHDSVRASNPGQNQVNTWTDYNSGNVYNTTSMTPQQIHALSLNKSGNKDAAAILAGMGLDINGNPTSVPAPQFTSSPSSGPSGASGGSGGSSSVSGGGGGYIPAPAVNSGQYAMTQAQIKAEAEARIARMTAEKTRVANQTKAGMQTSYDRMNTNIQQDRTMQDVRDQRSLNPFSGRTNYAQGIKTMERERTDRENQQDLQSKLGNVDMALSEFLNQTPEQQQQIINELTRSERDYANQVEQLALSRANVTGEYNGQKTAAQQNADRNFELAAKEQAERERQDRIKLTQWAIETFGGRAADGSMITPKMDAGLFFEQFAGLDTLRSQELKRLVENDDFDKAMKIAQEKRLISKDEHDRIMDAAQLKISQQNANTSAANAGSSSSNANHGRLMDVWKATGKAPAGIPGVTPGTPYYDPVAARDNGAGGKATDDSNYSEFVSDLPHISSYEEAAAYIDSFGSEISAAMRAKMLKEAQSKFNKNNN